MQIAGMERGSPVAAKTVPAVIGCRSAHSVDRRAGHPVPLPQPVDEMRVPPVIKHMQQKLSLKAESLAAGS